MATLQKQIDEMKRKADSALVDTALSFLQLLISNPTALFDPYATRAALESLVDAAREKKDDRAKRFAVVLRQCRPLVNNPAMQSILMKLVADKEEAEVAKVIDKAVRRQSAPANRGQRGASGRTRGSPYFRGNRGTGRQPQKCYSCGQQGHFARDCGKRS